MLKKLIRNLSLSHLSRPFDLLPLRGVGCEVGVNAGAHAVAMLGAHPGITRLFLVDPYLEYHQEKNLAGARRKAHGRLLNHPRATFLEMPCAKAGKHLPQLDFAYIDGDHSYEGVKTDISTIWPLIKNGGIMGGHDFHGTWPGTIRAVINFAAAKGLALNVESPDWWIVKI